MSSVLKLRNLKQVRMWEDKQYSEGWFNKENEDQFCHFFRGFLLSLHHGFGWQAGLYEEMSLDVIAADKVQATIRLASNIGLTPPVRFFDVWNPERKPLIVSGEIFDWEILEIEEFEEVIPVEHLETLAVLRKNGVEFDGYGVARPTEKHRVDPVLLGRFGMFWIEIGRWD